MTADRVMFITGSRNGIGRFLAEHYLAKGWQVAGCSRDGTDLVHEHYSHFACDVSDEGAVKQTMTALRRRYGRLDAAINNAGLAAMNHAMLTPGSTVQRVLQTNVQGTFLVAREAARLMQAKKVGRIVNFASVAAPLQLEGEAIYAASKAAVVALTQILARELAPFGITVNAVGPTPIRTDLIRGVPEDALEALVARQAVKRFGEMDDVANVIDFFLDPRSTFITGQTLYLGGVS